MSDAVIHPTPQELAAFGLGKLPQQAAAAIATHLELCSKCRQAVADVTPDSFLDKVRAAGPAGSSFPPSLAEPGNAPKSGERPAVPVAPCPNVPPELARHPKYLVWRELGRGGMGVVYQARHKEMDRQVVIKVINRSLLDRPDTLDRFRREIRAAAQLSHPNIVTAYDAEQAGDLHMLVMEFVPGHTLAEVLKKKGPLPVPFACNFARQVALGLQHAHECGLVHRDIKPQNLMLTPKGQVKILDFGLAKVLREGVTGAGLTAHNIYMGTPEYCAPEQATDARTADIRADLYSLGCTLYFLLSGHPPFQENTFITTILAHLQQQPRPLPELRPEVPVELWQVVARLLAKEPAQRDQKPIEVAQALASFIKTGAKQEAKSGSTLSQGDESPEKRTVIAADTRQLKNILQEIPGKTSPKDVPAKDEASPIAELGETSALPSGAKEAKESTTRMPAVWYRRWPARLAALSVITLLSFLVVKVLIGSRDKQPVQPLARPTLADIDDVILRAGHKNSIQFTVKRHDFQLPLTLRIAGLPDEVPAPLPLTLPVDEDKVSLTLLPPLGIALPPCAARVSLWDGDDKIDEKAFQVSIPLVPRPLLNAPEQITCQVGQSSSFAFAVQRNECPEALQLRLEGLPPEQVQQENAPAKDADTLNMKLTVAAGCTPQTIPVKLLLHVGDIVADSKGLLLDIRQDTSPVRPREEPKLGVRLNDKTPTLLNVESSKAVELPVVLKRENYRGDVNLYLDGLPAGATAAPVTVPAGSLSAILTVETAVEVQPGQHKVKLRLRVDEQMVAEHDITLSVRRPRVWQEFVQFNTVDHMELFSTLYRGWRGKKGMTVLMLHDLGSYRSSPGWKRLAEDLQTEGHTVLTFDFRGHGLSEDVSPAFWRYSVNKFLPIYDKALSPLAQPRKLDLDNLPTWYRPWLIEDIAAARTYLEVRHDEPDSPINTFNLVVIGAGQSSALGSLWLSTEGLRYSGNDVNGKTVLKSPEKSSILQAVWLGMADPHPNPQGISSWLQGAAAKPVVPITFVYGRDDIDTVRLLAEPLDKKYGTAFVIPDAFFQSAGQELLDKNSKAAEQIKQYLVETLQKLHPQPWVPRRIKTLHSYWAISQHLPGGREQVRMYVAKRAGEETLMPFPFNLLGIPIKGLGEQQPLPSIQNNTSESQESPKREKTDDPSTKTEKD
jgi:serine/threonine protein kinase/pimeloyl-ACP methyl ester carboxylesterase